MKGKKTYEEYISVSGQFSKVIWQNLESTVINNSYCGLHDI